MMRISKALLAVSMTSMLALTACGGETNEMAAEPATAAVDTTSEEEMTSEDDMDEDMATEEGMGDPAANLVGAGCADYAEAVPEGDGSVQGMAQDPSPWLPATTRC